ncbi:hypothetical protein PVL29_019400 [Vitis rotundifolia]|uniref:Uncharacterized protein n=1 Tax=Vitis rotundifolia TaxID=103349 RepID=A0AA38Z0H3_VITRO|nr:hypothetical protein PVL29_019400 [Vitis rotundifolia]
MFYVVSDEFLHAYGGDTSVNVCTKWRARVVDWLTSTNNSKQAFGSPEFSVAGFSARQTLLPDQMIHIPRKLKAQNSDIVWSGDAWICTKQLKHYPTFCRDETTIFCSFICIHYG